MVEQTLLHPITQPVIHKARIDRITLRGADGDLTAAWELQGARSPTGDASVKWFMTAPWQYPADGESIANLRTNLAKLPPGRLCGRGHGGKPCAVWFSIAALCAGGASGGGQTAETGSDGAVQTNGLAGEHLCADCGRGEKDNVDYVRVEDSLYLSSHFTMDVFMSIDPLNTVSRYPVMTALAQLQSLTIESPAGTEEYVIRRARAGRGEQRGWSPIRTAAWYTTPSARATGKRFSYDAFEAAYGQLLVVTVSGACRTAGL
jgi:hypothetical protein